MNEFKKYLHVERFGTAEVEGIELGTCHVFHKLDGTNASLWADDDGNLHAGSRTRELSIEKDNAEFYSWALEQEHLLEFMANRRWLRLYGEWLVPHSFKGYKEDAWRQFYVFDVFDESTQQYVPYDVYKLLLDEYNIDYIPPICTVVNGSYDQFVNQLKHAVFQVEDGKGAGEGIVIKNYDFINRFGRYAVAKIVSTDFKALHAKTMGGHEVQGEKMVELEVANEFVTKSLVDKVHDKIVTEMEGWRSQYIPRLLNTVYYDLVREESWEFIKKHKDPTINYRTLKQFTINKVKEFKPELF